MRLYQIARFYSVRNSCTTQFLLGLPLHHEDSPNDNNPSKVYTAAWVYCLTIHRILYKF